MKKLIVLILSLTVLTGCVNISNLNFDEIITRNITYTSKNNNIKRKGYSYTLLNGLKITNQDEYNDVIESENNMFYLYVDLVSYNNKKDFTYQINPNVYYSKSYELNNKKGYLEINELEKEKYLIEIMYNYAKIEVIVDECDLKVAVSQAMSILSSITYNDNIIKNLMGNDILNFSEEEFNIFETASTDNVLEIFENEVQNEESVPDTDLVN